jgi:hypothetical protein
LVDIEKTKSGATRCITNSQFAFNALHDLGLVHLYTNMKLSRKKEKQSWRLTLFGFFVAASFCIEPIDVEKEPCSNRITRLPIGGGYFARFSNEIIVRIEEFHKRNLFEKVLSFLEDNNLSFKNLDKIYNSLEKYIELVHRSKRDKFPQAKFVQEINNLLDSLYYQGMDQEYYSEMTEYFDTKAFIQQIKNQLEG